MAAANDETAVSGSYPCKILRKWRPSAISSHHIWFRIYRKRSQEVQTCSQAGTRLVCSRSSTLARSMNLGLLKHQSACHWAKMAIEVVSLFSGSFDHCLKNSHLVKRSVDRTAVGTGGRAPLDAVAILRPVAGYLGTSRTCQDSLH